VKWTTSSIGRTFKTRRALVAAAAVAAMVMAGCGTSRADDGLPGGGPGGVIADGVSTPNPSDSANPDGSQEVTIAFGGDVHFTDRTLKLLDNPDTAFGPIADVFNSVDLSMINLETAVTNRGTPEPKTFHFRAPATAFDAIKAAGVDVVTMANNHALDYGRVGLSDSLAAAQAAGVPLVGIGNNATEAFKPYIVDVRGTKIAFLGFSQIHELASTWAATDTRSGEAMAFDTNRAVKAVSDAKKAADIVVVYMHWGQEYNPCPTSEMKTFAKKISDAGATMVLGTHAHVALGDGMLGNTYVQYGMSNFLWWMNDAQTNDTGVFKVSVLAGKVSKVEFVPAYIDRTTGQPKPVTGAEATRITKVFTDARKCTGLTAPPTGND
jgi:poly-gamma-glutamate synthesis protein (capsule biosynthesis protein)